MHAHQEGQSSGFSQMKPGGVVLFKAKVAAKEEERGRDGLGRRILVMVARLAHMQRIFQQRHADGDVGVNI